MSTSEMVRNLCDEQNISLAELARRTGQSRQNLYNKLKSDSISVVELNRIAEAFDMKYEPVFVCKD